MISRFELIADGGRAAIGERAAEAILETGTLADKPAPCRPGSGPAGISGRYQASFETTSWATSAVRCHAALNQMRQHLRLDHTIGTAAAGVIGTDRPQHPPHLAKNRVPGAWGGCEQILGTAAAAGEITFGVEDIGSLYIVKTRDRHASFEHQLGHPRAIDCIAETDAIGKLSADEMEWGIAKGRQFSEHGRGITVLYHQYRPVLADRLDTAAHNL
jgi:hypothetical protein